ncbi:helicase HerA domain-containing protein [Izhakiella capsodis]
MGTNSSRALLFLCSIGSGKSYALAVILERASKIKYPNIVVFDMQTYV